MNTTPTYVDLLLFAEFLKAKATHLRSTARTNCSVTDLGAAALEREVEIFCAGLRNKVPETWQKDFATFSSEEYQTYLKLHEKYGGKETP